MITVVVPGDRMKRLPHESIPERKRRQRERQQRDVIKQDRCVEVLVLVWLVWVGAEEEGEEGGGTTRALVRCYRSALTRRSPPHSSLCALQVVG